jgi:hypothetical protein
MHHDIFKRGRFINIGCFFPFKEGRSTSPAGKPEVTALLQKVRLEQASLY